MSVNLTWWPDLKWPGVKYFTHSPKLMCNKLYQAARRYTPRFFSYTQKKTSTFSYRYIVKREIMVWKCCSNFYHIAFRIQAPNSLGTRISKALIWGFVLLGLKPFRQAIIIAGLWHGRLRGGNDEAQAAWGRGSSQQSPLQGLRGRTSYKENNLWFRRHMGNCPT